MSIRYAFNEWSCVQTSLQREKGPAFSRVKSSGAHSVDVKTPARQSSTVSVNCTYATVWYNASLPGMPSTAVPQVIRILGWGSCASRCRDSVRLVLEYALCQVAGVSSDSERLWVLRLDAWTGRTRSSGATGRRDLLIRRIREHGHPAQGVLSSPLAACRTWGSDATAKGIRSGTVHVNEGSNC